MKNTRRIKVTISQPMAMALEILAERSGLPLASQALAVLRAGLDRTIHSAECQDRLAKAGAFRTRDAWLDDRATDTEAERTLVAAGLANGAQE